MNISAVVVSFNSERFLKQNFESLFRQTVAFKQVIVVDNASSDDSLAVMDMFPMLKKTVLPVNVGYAAAANLGIRQADSDLVLVANSDIFLASDFNQRVLEFFSGHPQAGLLSPLILRFDRETIDSAGQICSRALYPREAGFNQRLARTCFGEREVFSVCGAATVFSRNALEKLKIDNEYYDEDFFMFWEDFDIGWRAKLLGLKTFFSPGAVVYHFRSATLKKTMVVTFFHGFGAARAPALSSSKKSLSDAAQKFSLGPILVGASFRYWQGFAVGRCIDNSFSQNYNRHGSFPEHF